MKKAAIILANGCEEGETLTIVDILRRANIQCDMFGFEKVITGGHDISIQCDYVLNNDITNYDMVILPGGYDGAHNLKNSKEVMDILHTMNKQGKYICAMCAAPIVLEAANLLINKNFTAYKGYDKKIKQGNYLEDKVVIDGNIVTSRGPATPYPFAFKIMEVFNIDPSPLKDRLMYNFAGGK